MARPLHGPRPWAREGDVAALDLDLALARRQRDAAAGLNADLVGGALHGQVFVRPDLLRVGVGAQAQARVGGDGLDAAGVGVQAGGLAADGAHGVGCGQVGVALRGQAGVLAAEQADAGRGDPAGAGRGVEVQQGFGKTLHRIGQGAAALGLLGFLSTHAAFVAALRLGVHLLGVVLQRLLGVVAGQALRPLLAGALAQGLAQLAGALELRHGLHRVHLAAGHAAAHGRAGCGGEQQALARAHHGPAVGGAVKAFSQPLAPAGVARTALAAVLNEVAQAQLAPASGRAVAGQAHAQLARGVVHHPLVGALAV